MPERMERKKNEEARSLLRSQSRKGKAERKEQQQRVEIHS